MSAFLKYRPEIDGLRAFAVISVILFHMDSAWLPGGFVGVDVFFVISGYLISTIIINQLEHKNFSLLDFYAKRIKRILPAIYIVLIFTIVIGYLLFQQKDIDYLVHSIKYVIFFWSNSFFASTGDYFSPKFSELPLLHTWSLSVEEQFYFFLPILLITLYKFKKNLILFPLILTCFSFLICEYLLIKPKYTSFSYYSLITRSGELLIGYITALFIKKDFLFKASLLKLFVTVIGASLIVLSLLLLNKSSKFPGVNALPVCLGSAMLIYGITQENVLFYKFFSSKFLVLIGRMSYSLYLWHYPILAYLRYVYGSYNLPSHYLAFGFILTIIFSFISYRFIENKARFLRLNFSSSFLLFYVVPSVSIFFLIAILNKTELADKEKISPLYVTYGGEELCHGKINDKCIRGDKNQKPDMLVVGDSHAAHYNYFFEELGQKCGWSAEVLSSSSCSPVLNFNESILDEWAHEGCKALKTYFWKHYTEYKTIVLASRWEFHLGLSGTEGTDPNFLEKLDETLNKLAKNVKKVYVLSQIPLLSNNPFRIKKFFKIGLPISIKNHSQLVQIANNKVKKLTEKYANVIWVDMTPLFKYFGSGILYEGNSVYMDNNHLNQFGARALALIFYKNVLDDINRPKFGQERFCDLCFPIKQP